MDFPTIISLTESEFNIPSFLSRITLPTTGATVFFTGIVRGQTSRGEPRVTFYLDYETYRPMAESKMQQVADEIRKKWKSVEGIVIVQRIGRLSPGTPTTLIGCSSGHRNSGIFEAAHYGIDRLKEIVPVWKKEIGPEIEEWIEGDYYPKPGE
jgi:molybdopterin synthase catalytic subunit